MINTKNHPPGFATYRNVATESRAYYEMTPYPYFGFQSWRTEKLGPYPRCLPIPYGIIRRSAIWLFGKPISFTMPGSDPIDKELHRLWNLNDMDSLLVNLAIRGGVDGSVTIKFVIDPKADIPVRFIPLSNVDQVTYFYDPHDKKKLLMVRVQYPYYDIQANKHYWYREEWTNEYEVHYHPIEIVSFGVDRENPYKHVGTPLFPDINTQTEWKESRRTPNRIGFPPFVNIKNIENGTDFGSGDLFSLFRLIDRINLTYFLIDRSNQLDIDPRTIFIDLEPKEGETIDAPVGPGGLMDLQSVEGDTDNPTKQGKVEFLEYTGKVREHLHKYASEIKQSIFDATGAVFPRQEEVTNKGSLTQSVLIQMYKPLLETTAEKRKTYGTNGIALLLKKVVLAMKNMEIHPYNKLKSVKSLYDEKLRVDLTWFNQFELTEDEKFAEYDRLSRAVMGSFITPKDGIRRIHQLEELVISEEEENELIKEIEDAKEKSVADEFGAGRSNDTGNTRRKRESEGESKKQTAGRTGSKSRQQKKGVRVRDAE